jgi:nicotinamidase/pyrazinamidase
MEEEKKLLFITDPQFDFINGSLAVPDAERAMNALADYVKENKDTYAGIVVSVDSHPWNHCSFNDVLDPSTGQGGIWPRHCVMHSVGAAIWTPLLEQLGSTDVFILDKGYQQDREEYSLLQCLDSNYTFHQIISELKITTVDFCGIVREVCVMNTIKDFINSQAFKDIKVNVLLDYTPTLDNGVEFDKFLSENHQIQVVK